MRGLPYDMESPGATCYQTVSDCRVPYFIKYVAKDNRIKFSSWNWFTLAAFAKLFLVMLNQRLSHYLSDKDFLKHFMVPRDQKS